MRVLVTRPQQDSERLADILALCGHEVIVSPLLSIVPLEWEFPSENIDALVLTSHNAVTSRHNEKLTSLSCYCIGDATAAAARAAGFSVVAACGSDRTALVQKIAADNIGHALFLSGHEERADLVAELAASGVAATRRRVYDAQAVGAFSPAAAAALQENQVDRVLLFSPRSAALFSVLFERLPQAEKSRVALACLSAAVADAAGADWAQIVVAHQPTTTHLLAASGLLCDSAREVLKDRV